MQIKMSVNLFHLLNDENTLVTTTFSKKENQMKNNGLSQPANKQHTPLPMAAAAAASTISTPSSFLCSSTQRRSTNYIFTSSLLLSHKPTLSTSSIPQLGLCSISSSSWDGLRKNMGIPIRTKFVKIVRKGRYTGKVYASLFGVGAPEALVIGVVALLVFGPKGLAEVARNLGKTLRAFQPTIRELQEVSREFKSTLEREIGLDDIPPSSQNTYRPPTTTASSSPTTTTSSPTPSNADPENSEAVIDPNGTPAADKPANIGEFLVAAQIASQKNKTTPQEDQSESQPQPQATSTTGEVAAPDISTAPEVTSTAEVAATDISTAPEVASTVPEPRKLETEKDIPPSN